MADQQFGDIKKLNEKENPNTQYIRDQGFAARSSSPSFGSIAVAFSRSMAVRLVLDLAAVSILWVA